MRVSLEHLAADVLGLPQSCRDLLSGQAAVSGLELVRDVNSCARPTTFLDRDERAALVATMTRELAHFAPHVAVLDNVQALDEANTSVVLATAPARFLGAPLFAEYSAWQVTRVASELSRAWDQQVVPLLWITSDGSSAERSAWFRNADANTQCVSWDDPVSAASIEGANACLRQLLRGAEHLNGCIERWQPQPNETPSQATVRTLLDRHGDHGLIVVAADWFQADTAHFLGRVFTHELEGSTAQFSEFEPLVFHRDAEGWSPLWRGGDGFRYADEPGSRTTSELAAAIVQAPGEFRASEALLPLILDALFPVALRLVDRHKLHGEAWLAAHRRQLDLEHPPLLPRLELTLVDEPLRAALQKLGLEPASVLRDREAWIDPPPSESLRPAIDGMRQLASDSAARLRELARPLGEFDPVLHPVSRRAASELRQTVEDFASKAERVLDNRGGKVERHQRIVRTKLWPQGSAQAESDSPFAWEAHFGAELWDALRDEIDPFAWEHLLVRLP